MKKPFYKKWWVWLIAVIVLIALITPSDEEVVEEDTEPVTSDEQVETEEEKEESDPVEEEIKATIKEDNGISFGDFTVEVRDYEIYEEEGTHYLDLEIRYTNDSFPEEKSFMAANLFYVKQGESELTETSGVTDNPNSNYFYKNKVGIFAPIKFTFELDNIEDDIELYFNPNNDYEEAETITIELN